jgi:hypothetical protein
MAVKVQIGQQKLIVGAELDDYVGHAVSLGLVAVASACRAACPGEITWIGEAAMSNRNRTVSLPGWDSKHHLVPFSRFVGAIKWAEDLKLSRDP